MFEPPLVGRQGGWGERCRLAPCSAETGADIAAQINKVYKQADYVGSLVVEGRTGRPTEYAGLHVEPPDWWDVFWQRHFENTGQSREEAMEMLGKMLGRDWDRATLAEAEKAMTRTRHLLSGIARQPSDSFRLYSPRFTLIE